MLTGRLDEQVCVGNVAVSSYGEFLLVKLLLVCNLWCRVCKLEQAICNTIRSMAKTIFADYIGKYQIKEIEFENLSLGTLPPIFYGECTWPILFLS